MCYIILLSAAKENKGARRAKSRHPGLTGGERRSGKALLRTQQVALDLKDEYEGRAGDTGVGVTCAKALRREGAWYILGI